MFKGPLTKILILLTASLGAIATFGGPASDFNSVTTWPVEPRADRIMTERVLHGVKLQDEFAWLKAPNWQEALNDAEKLPSRIRNYLQAENRYFQAMMAPLVPLQKKLYQELRGRMVEDDATVPVVDGNWAYYWRYVPGKNHRQFLRRPVMDAVNQPDLFTVGRLPEDQLILDVNRLALDRPGFNLGSVKHSPDHRLLAYSIDNTGAESYRIQVRSLATGKDLNDTIDNSDGNFEWLVDGSGFLYVGLDSNRRARQVWKHRLGTPQSADKLVFEAPQESGFFTSVWRTRDDRFYGIGCGDFQTGEVYLIAVDDPQMQPRLIAAREPDLQYSINLHGDTLYIRTNADGANDFKIVTAPLKTPQRRYWKDLIPHRPGRFITSVGLFANHLVRKERENGLERLVIRRLSDGKEHALAFNEEAYSLGFSTGYTFDTPFVRLNYSSMITPPQIIDYHMETRQRLLRKQLAVPSGYDRRQYVTHRLQASAPDGEKVPVTLLYQQKTALDGTAPLLIQAYGAYGLSQHAHFRKHVFSLVDRGFVVALAHVRGGMDKGYAWYTGGRGLNKPNTFSDFLAVAHELIRQGYTHAGRIVAYAASAGGMIIGVAANQAPQLFCAMITDVPFVDVLNTMLDDSLPLTPSEWPEWGNPLTDKQAFETILSYSPYDNVRPQDYPHLLVLASLADSRVTYWEPAKWVARLRDKRTNDNALLLRTDMSSGHVGVSGRFSGLQGVAMIYAFAIKAINGRRCQVASPLKGPKTQRTLTTKAAR